MRKFCFLFFAILFFLNSYAQELSLDQNGSSVGDTVRQNSPRYVQVYHDNIGCPDYKVFAEYTSSDNKSVSALLKYNEQVSEPVDLSKPIHLTAVDKQNNPMQVMYHRIWRSDGPMENSIVFCEGDVLDVSSFTFKCINKRDNVYLWSLILLVEDSSEGLCKVVVNQNGPWPILRKESIEEK